MPSMFARSYYNFLHDVRSYETIEDYFQIPSDNPEEKYVYGTGFKEKSSLRISMKRCADTLYFNMMYRSALTKRFVEFKDLPDDINRHIHSYLGDAVTLMVKIEYPRDFPQSPPRWSFIHVTHTLQDKWTRQLRKYYDALVTSHNKQCNERWFNTCIGTDLSHFIQKANHFEHVIEMNKY